MKRKVIVWCLSLAVLAVSVTIGCKMYVKWASHGRTSSQMQELPSRRVAVVLGTSPVSRYTRKANPYYYFRIDAAVRLYKEGKVKLILVSGDNRRKEYNEPDMMKADLVKAGIPAEHIYCDYAGFRTLDSIVRAKKVFGLDSFIVVSQHFHNVRAITYARWQGIEAFGYNARNIAMQKGLKVQLREVLARVKMVLDMLINKQPHFLGDMIEIK